MLQNILVYLHRSNLTNEVFYVGVGSKKKSKHTTNRSVFWKNIVSKHGYTIEIVKSNLNSDDAFKLEKSLISLYGRRDLNKGTLVNLTDGGEGSYGVIKSEETKEKLRIKNKGKTLTKEHKLNIGLANKGKDFSEEARKNQRLRVSKKVINIDTLEVYNSAKEVSVVLGIKPLNFTRQLNGYCKNKTKFKYYE